jgi:ATP-dependent Clp protease protease subunit
MNFKKLALGLVTVVLSLTSAVGFAVPMKAQYAKSKPTTSVEYDVNNTVTLRGVINSASVSKAVEGIALSKSDEVYLFIQSPGGSIIDGMTLVNFIRSTDKKVICVADIAISMAFVILQSCDERLSTANSITMQHHASFGAQRGESPNVVNFVNFLLKMDKELDIAQAARIGITVEKFQKNIDRDWWLFGSDVSKENVTDRTVTAVCSRKLLESTVTEKISVMGGLFEVTLTWSGCPEILDPKSIEITKEFTNQFGYRERVAVTGETRVNIEQELLARRFVSAKLGFGEQLTVAP